MNNSTLRKNNSEISRPFRVIICGAGGVGKSALTVQFCQDHFIEEYSPTIEDIYRKSWLVNNERVSAEIYDTAGQESICSMNDQIFANGDGFLIIFSLEDTQSFESAKQYHQQIMRCKSNYGSFPVIFVGNKCDLPIHNKELFLGEIKTYCDSNKIYYMETSAKTKTNVQTIFDELVKIMRASQQQRLKTFANQSNIENKKNNSKCSLM